MADEYDPLLEEAYRAIEANDHAALQRLRPQLDAMADKIRAEIRAKHGVLNVAVQLVREARGGNDD
jgi:hypothetical protein